MILPVATKLKPADRTQFPLPKADWERFTQRLERPAKVPAGLRKLFSKPSVFDQ
jgi:uncharacterized protein (DUF1778 family)